MSNSNIRREYNQLILDSSDEDWNWWNLSRSPWISIDVITTHSNKNWDWYCVSCNPCITWDNIIDNPHIKWNWKAISCNPNITVEIIRNNLEYKWEWDRICISDFDVYQSLADIIPKDDQNVCIYNCWENIYKNPDSTWEQIYNGLQEYPQLGEMYNISMHPCVTPDIVATNNDIDWDNTGLCLNPNFEWGFIEKQLKDDPEIKMWRILYIISSNPNINWEIIKNNSDLQWNLTGVNRNPNITIKHVLSNIDWKWEWDTIYCISDIAVEDVVKLPLDSTLCDKIRIDVMEHNVNNTTWSQIQTHYLEKGHIRMSRFGQHTCITWDIIQSYPTLDWDMETISRNPNITFDIVNNNPNMKWSQYDLITNPSIKMSPELIRENPDIWNNFIILSIPSLFTFD
jgi:hypothetical protein